LRASSRGSSDEEGRHFLTQTANGCQKMLQIIDELLLLASVRKRGEVPRTALDMARVVNETRQRLSRMMEESGAELIVPRDWPPALGHAPWVEEVWANYISNAIKYGGSPPRVELGADRNGDGKVHLWVRDNGQGLDEKQIGQLFAEFSRLAAARAEGHGLGLSIVKRIVERLGGEVSVTSTVGQGSTFGFTCRDDRQRGAPVPNTLMARLKGIVATAVTRTSRLPASDGTTG
jgi:two-component system sensor histidine kinase/response regulator